MLVPISKVCYVLGVCEKTLRGWEERGYINPYRTPGNHRRYDYDALVEFQESCVYDPKPEQKTGMTAVYARVSSHKQKEDLVR
jgi:predicted site-specific integrase-resolvase